MLPFAGRKVSIALPSAAPDRQPTRVTATIGKDLIKFSLRTADAELAKRRHAAAWEQITRQVETWKAGPKSLGRKQIKALAGRVYFTMAEAFEDEPGRASDWATINSIASALVNQDHWRVRLAIGDEAKKRAATAALEESLGKWVDAVLETEGIVTDVASRETLLWDVAKAIRDASAKLRRNAEGDYTPDPSAATYPAWERPAAQPVVRGKPAMTITATFEKWVAHKRPSVSTATTYRGHVRQFVAFLKHEDPRLVTKADALGWKDALHEQGIVRINAGHLNSLRTVFRFAKAEDITEANPFENVRAYEPRRPDEDREPYTDAEVGELLSICRQETDPARRWMVPLIAFSGARAAEIAQLWGRRIEQHENYWAMQIAPAEDGGSLKNEGSKRIIPLHSALIADGFLDFAQSRGDGPLFYAPQTASGSPKSPFRKHTSKGVTNRVAEWVRSKVNLRPNVAPLHSLRHWFSTKAQRVGIGETLVDAILGHKGKGGASAVYRHAGRLRGGRVEGLEAMAAAIEKITIPNVSPASTNAPPKGPPSGDQE